MKLVPASSIAAVLLVAANIATGQCLNPQTLPQMVDVSNVGGQTHLTLSPYVLNPPYLVAVRVDGTEVTADFILLGCPFVTTPPPGGIAFVNAGYLPPGVYQLLVRSGFGFPPTTFLHQARRTFVVQGGGAASVPIDGRWALMLLGAIAAACGLIALRR